LPLPRTWRASPHIVAPTPLLSFRDYESLGASRQKVFNGRPTTLATLATSFFARRCRNPAVLTCAAAARPEVPRALMPVLVGALLYRDVGFSRGEEHGFDAAHAAVLPNAATGAWSCWAWCEVAGVQAARYVLDTKLAPRACFRCCGWL
jgi:hypothetical protein